MNQQAAKPSSAYDNVPSRSMMEGAPQNPPVKISAQIGNFIGGTQNNVINVQP
jgi:hypothetical protein